MDQLTKEELESVKRSFFNLLALFLGNEQVESKYVACLMKWSVQLNLTHNDLHHIEGNFNKLIYIAPEDKLSKMEAIYHLVHMIYIDNIVEDIELEVATIYAEKLGFDKSVVGELFKAIATAPYDGKTKLEVKQEVKEFLELHDMK
ncbi:hypothetical protein JMN32_01910 [Fulvivirga sp. 29W222]|uniref:TerB family tellurite resistance protein n=1 Tax=Fulvivirga marina TaxID=2494733 RepID=A0A937FT74_9BACT|nr:hypothetical protein [Fulvivirga marina]MBL6445044.1 hypothetical protein [Fulvivirga marina]